MTQVSLDELVTRLRSGECLISFPTDTVPALAARPDQAALIFEAKQRSLDKPLILMAATIADLWTYVTGSAEERRIWQQVADHYLPGALTLVLPASDRVPAGMNPKDPSTIGVRVPDRAVAHAILSRTGPLATTSANRSGQSPLLTMEEIEQQFPQVLTLSNAELETLEGLQSVSPGISSGVPSTVIQWTGAGWKLLRQGAVKMETITGNLGTTIQ
ncbi:L-threonylcarbamoyladenylate synthase [Leptothermofonsia sichuanensis E412]|uniref:L-threonylcarbamoyladenylate synthase n=1 Tax=Leptothermofonsia sichuanensis TaxID=2917832 RepID=UPI001CA69C5E|nr:L-threonylcarbamoyladenylate synthase [Leptothermofonsia sichuanensis]QZZ21801.1 L-threonylcarbamoyladenylate synthase [Leptothermofonsia sichuanensis E412]